MNMEVSRIEKKIENIRKIFQCLSPEEKIQHILELGRQLPPFPNEEKTPQNLISGCQSSLYISSRLENGKIYLNAHADALISLGLAALLISVYDNEPPEVILKTPPTFLTDLGILHSLTPSRANGIAHIHQRIKKDALNFLIQQSKSVAIN